MTPHISVIIPAYNEEKLIGKCLSALTKQDYPHNLYEIILVDPNSTDQTNQIAKNYPVKIVWLNHTPTIGSTRQAGVDIARGEILAFVDSDIQVPNNWLTMIADILSDDHLLCIGGEVMPDSDKWSLILIYRIYSHFILLNQRIFKKILIWGSNMAVKRDAFSQINGFSKDMEMSEDWELGKRLQSKFGLDTVVYSNKISVKTSIRKQKNILIFLSYLINGLINYLNFVFLNISKTSKPKHIR